MTHVTEIEVGGELVPTLADILPERGELRALFLATTSRARLVAASGSASAMPAS
jgi:hypothetical protein